MQRREPAAFQLAARVPSQKAYDRCMPVRGFLASVLLLLAAACSSNDDVIEIHEVTVRMSMWTVSPDGVAAEDAPTQFLVGVLVDGAGVSTAEVLAGAPAAPEALAWDEQRNAYYAMRTGYVPGVRVVVTVVGHTVDESITGPRYHDVELTLAPAVGAPLNVTWSPHGDATYASVSLQHTGDSFNSGVGPDDGEEMVPESALPVADAYKLHMSRDNGSVHDTEAGDHVEVDTYVQRDLEFDLE
jgi:hypothetical protein